MEIIQKSKIKTQNLINKFVLPIILLLAAFLRLYRIEDYMTFLGDEGRDVLKVYDILHGHLTLLGPTSSVGGFFLGPIYYYFMAPFLWIFNYNPVGPAIMVALFGVATVYLLHRFCSELFNKRVAVVASSLYAVSPLVIAYSRSSWNPNLMPFFTLLCLYFLYKASVKNSSLYLLISGILLGIAMQLHYLATFLGVIIFLYILFSEIISKINLAELIKKYFIILIGFIIGWSPFIAFEIRHGFLNTKKIFDFVFNGGNTGDNTSFIANVSDVFFRLFARLLSSFPPPEQLFKYDKTLINIWTILIFALSISCTIYAIYLLYKNLKEKKSDYKKYLLLTVWFLAGIILFGFYKKSIYDYYFVFLFPVPFILSGLLLDFIYMKKAIGKVLVILVFLILFTLNLLGLPFRYEPNRQLNQMKTIADFVMTRTDAKSFNFALISGGNSDFAYRYFFTVWDHPASIIEDPAKDPQRNSVKEQLFVVCESPLPCQPLGHSLWEIAGFGRAEIVGHWKVSVVEVYKLVHYKENGAPVNSK